MPVGARKRSASRQGDGQAGADEPAWLGSSLGPATVAFYREALLALHAAEVPFLVGGAYALERYTGVSRYTKDLDVFLRRRDLDVALAALDSRGWRTERTHPHWLAKAYERDDFVDLIYCSGNGVSEVDEAWFDNAVPSEVLGVPAGLCPVEEMIWSKAFLMERERYDGADVAHLIRARADGLSWPRLLERFGPHWRVLLGHLVLFGFVYPSQRSLVPAEVMHELLGRLEAELQQPDAVLPVCRGTLVSRAQYLVDVSRWGFRDGRLAPEVRMSAADIADWTRAIDAPEQLQVGEADDGRR